MAGVVGWFMVLRRQSFAGHTLAVMSFPGAAGAALAGVPRALGYFLACGDRGACDRRAAGGAATPRARSESAAIGVVQVAGLALGFLFLSLYGGVLEQLETLLFGTFLGIDRDAGADAAGRRGRRAGCARGSSGGRCCSPRSTRRSRARVACPCGRSTSASCWCSAWRSPPRPDHGRAARVRAARRAAGRRAGAHAAAGAEPRAERRLRAAVDLAGARDRLLLDLPARLLRDLARVRVCGLYAARARRTRAWPSLAPAARGHRSRSQWRDARARIRPQRVARRHVRRRSRAAWSAGSWCCAARCSRATRSAMSLSSGRSPRPRSGVDERVGLFALTLGLAARDRRAWAGGARPTT